MGGGAVFPGAKRGQNLLLHRKEILNARSEKRGGEEREGHCPSFEMREWRSVVEAMSGRRKGEAAARKVGDVESLRRKKRKGGVEADQLEGEVKKVR